MYPYDEADPYMEEPLQPGIVLKKAAAKRTSAGNALTNNVLATPASVLPNAIDSLRSRAGDLYKQGADLYNSDPDMTQMQEFAKQRGQQGERSMLNALAAQFAGESFAPVQEQMLKRSAAASEPMKFGAGMLSSDGRYIKDPFAAQDKKAEFLLSQAKMYEQMATTAESKQAEQAYRAKQDMFMNELRSMNAQTSRMNAMGGGGGLGVGAAQQIGSGPKNEAIFRQKNGQLFTYDLNGDAVAYQGEILPRATNAQPSEDERKAAGWFFQADNARRNMEAVVKKNPQAAYPTVGERTAGFIPGVGEDFANQLRPEDRQKFVQAGSSMAEALLRAATGAGMNEYEAKQKVRELVPQLGDKPGLVTQKTASYDVYMKSLQARAGRALPQNSPGSGPSADNDPFGVRARMNGER
jgi:hypothetical protein